MFDDDEHPDHTPAQHDAVGLRRRRLVGRWDEWQLRIGFARTSHGDDYVADGAQACSLTAEQEEGPFYVALDKIREDVVGGQTGVPLQLEITVIKSLAYKPLKRAAVDIWHCNTPGIYSDISSENNVGKTYLRGVQLTDKHGRLTFKTIFPGHYAGRTTHIHAKVHISAQRSNGKLAGGHVAHTRQLFPSQAVYTEVYKLSAYRTETALIVTHARDRGGLNGTALRACSRSRRLGTG